MKQPVFPYFLHFLLEESAEKMYINRKCINLSKNGVLGNYANRS